MDPVALEGIAEWFLIYKYWLIFPVVIVEGPVVMTLGGFLLRLGYFEFWPLYLTLVAGDLAADAFWYWVGHRGKPFIERYGKYVNVTEKELIKVEHAFEKHPNKILFLSKITMGLGFAMVTLIAAGMSRVPFRKYILFNALGEFVWAGLLMALGYFLGQLYETVNEGLRYMMVGAFFVIVFFALRGFGIYLRKRAETKEDI